LLKESNEWRRSALLSLLSSADPSSRRFVYSLLLGVSLELSGNVHGERTERGEGKGREGGERLRSSSFLKIEICSLPPRLPSPGRSAASLPSSSLLVSRLASRRDEIYMVMSREVTKKK